MTVALQLCPWYDAIFLHHSITWLTPHPWICLFRKGANISRYPTTKGCYFSIENTRTIAALGGYGQWRIYIQKFLAHSPPQQDQILSFLHMFSPKSTCVGGWCTLQWGLTPPPPNGKSWIRPWWIPIFMPHELHEACHLKSPKIVHPTTQQPTSHHPATTLPKLDKIVSFFHTLLQKSARVGGQRPSTSQWSTQREYWTRHWEGNNILLFSCTETWTYTIFSQ